eukprot:m.73737 g.73737  ORF g.73737 m.73737 type:complete len:371 (+) comp8427_c0_seq2:122-1234(+)
MERGGRGGERGMMIDGRDSSSGERRKYHHSHTSGGGSRIGMRVFELLSELEGEIILLQAENASLRKRLAVAGLEVVDDPYIFPAEIQPLDAGIEGNNKGRSGKTVSKKIQEAYQASTNRLVSTFARTVEHSPFVCSPIQTYRGHEDGVWDVCAFNQGDKEMIASASADRTVMVWSLQSGECVSTYEGHVGSVNAVCVRQLQDKLLAFSASGDTTVHIWNPLPLSRKREGSQEEAHFNKPELVLRGHSHVVSSLALFSDEVLTGSHDCSLRLWEMETGKCVTDFTGHQLEVTGVMDLGFVFSFSITHMHKPRFKPIPPPLFSWFFFSMYRNGCWCRSYRARRKRIRNILIERQDNSFVGLPTVINEGSGTL